MMSAMVARALLLTILAPLLGGCTKHFDSTELERVIARGLNAKLAPLELTVETVECPAKVAMKKDQGFRCTATFEGGGKLPVDVDQKDDAGNIVFRIEQEIVTASKVEQSIGQLLAKKRGVKAAVDCGNRVYPSVPKTVFQCAATDSAGEVLVFDVTITDDQGNVRWKPAARPE